MTAADGHDGQTLAFELMSAIRRWSHDPGLATRTAKLSAEELAQREGWPREVAAAVVDRRLDELLARGVHPLMFVYLGRIYGFAVADRWREIERARETGPQHGA